MSDESMPPVHQAPSGQASPSRPSSPSSDQHTQKSSANGSITPQSASMGLPALYSPIPRPSRNQSHLHDPALNSPRPLSRASSHTTMSRTQSLIEESQVPPCLLSPAFTPPTSAPGTPSLLGVSTAGQTHTNPNLMKDLPEVNCVVRARIPTTTGTEIFLHLYQNNIDNKEHLAIVFGDKIRSKSLDAPREGETEMDRMIRGAYTGRLFPGRMSSLVKPDSQGQDGNSSAPSHISEAQKRMTAPLVRIHSECYTGETAWSARCDCGEQLDEAARLMAMDPAGGVIVYLRQEGRGIGLGEKLKAYNLQDLGNDTVQANLILRHPADARSYGLATSILVDLDCSEIRLLTNNPDKIAAVEGPGKEIRVVSRVSMVPKMWRGITGGVEGKEVSEYLRTKITKMGHLLDSPVPNFSSY
ncbi:GTP cyclohydrolase II-domain-containing protein [Peziza echinospora]|nr:GTP cyclohydrolase II-domain-containing protein [Peziza echinospora]